MEKPGGGEEPRGRCTATTPASPAPSLRKLSKHPAAFVDTTTELVYLLLRYLLIRSLSLSLLYSVFHSQIQSSHFAFLLLPPFQHASLSPPLGDPCPPTVILEGVK